MNMGVTGGDMVETDFNLEVRENENQEWNENPSLGA